MTKQAIIEKTVEILNRLPEEKGAEISDFADFISKRYEDEKVNEGILQMTSNSQSFEFLHDEEDLYSEADLKKVYNG